MWLVALGGGNTVTEAIRSTALVGGLRGDEPRHGKRRKEDHEGRVLRQRRLL